MSDEKYFRIRAHRPKDRDGGPWPKVLLGKWREPVEAADDAEMWLMTFGKPGESFCDLLYNGDTEPYSSVFYIKPGHFGIWNRSDNPWPIDYIDVGMVGELIPRTPLEIHPQFLAAGEDDPVKAQDEEGKRKKGEDAEILKIDGDDEEDAESDSEDEDDWEDAYDDDEAEGSEDAPDGGSEGDDEDDEGEADEEDDEDESDGGEEDEADDEMESDDDDFSDDQKEPDMPRLTIFAKMRGPKGWRKRAEIEDLNERNVFGFKVGVVDDSKPTPAKQEQDVVVFVKFVEDNAERDAGYLTVQLPRGVELERQGTGRYVARVPYRPEDDK